MYLRNYLINLSRKSQCGEAAMYAAGSIQGACWNSPMGPNMPGNILAEEKFQLRILDYNI